MTMYVPGAFRADDQASLAFMAKYNFATLITADETGVPAASHLPFLLRQGDGADRLIGHMAKANAQWQSFGEDREVLVVFSGPHAYVSPSLYPTHPSVPTWNYMTVHAYGRPRVIADDEMVREYLQELIALHEAGAERPWRLEGPQEYLAGMMSQIVPFEITLSRIEGKFKLSQNRPADRERIGAHFAASEDSALRELGRAMRTATTQAQP